MADTAAERVRRSRAHAKGEHHLCLPKNCKDAPRPARTVRTITAAPPLPPAEDDPDRELGRIEKLATAFVAMLPHGPDDPRHMIGALAVELARRVDETGAAPAAIRELRVMLNQLAEAPNGPAGVVDEFRLKHHQQQFDALLAVS